MPHDTDESQGRWPALPWEAWHETHATLHLWLQIVGKIRLAQSTWLNHSWHVTLRVNARGLTTGLMRHHSGAFEIAFDFVDHCLRIDAPDGRRLSLPLVAQSTAAFYRRLMAALDSLDLHVDIRATPSELPDPIPFDRDEVHGAYDPQYVARYGRVLASTAHVLEDFRARFIGKCSPVHFFWGAADLAVTRFSGRVAPEHPGGVPNLPDPITREAYSHEVSSCGFWAGSDSYPRAAFYAYAYPEPPGFAAAPSAPEAARYDEALREFVLPYDEVRRQPDPDTALMQFLQSTYEAAANVADWDRHALEREAMPPR